MMLQKKFITDAEDGRDADMPIITIAAGSEPIMFSQHFHGWDADFMEKRSFKDPYAAKLAAMKAEEKKRDSEILASQPAAEEAAAPAPAPVAAASPGAYTYEQLQGRVAGIDATKKRTILIRY